MKRVTSIAAAWVAAVILAVGANVGAQDFNTQERTFLTFSNSVELPGMTLPAGTYTFRLADTQSRSIVQVLSQDEKEVHGQFLFVPAERQTVTGETVITFRETREGATPAVQYWYYPGEKIGKEFIYPKDQAMKIATRTGATVMTEDGPVSANSTASSTDAQGQVTEWQRDQTTAAPSEAQVAGTSGVGDQNAQSTMPQDTAHANTAPADSSRDSAQANVAAAEPAEPVTGQSAQSQQVPADVAASRTSEPSPIASDDSPQPVGTSGTQNAQQPESVDARAELPRTASPLALSGLIGLLSLAGALGLRSFRS
jgi:hypothetical protein